MHRTTVGERVPGHLAAQEKKPGPVPALPPPPSSPPIPATLSRSKPPHARTELIPCAQFLPSLLHYRRKTDKYLRGVKNISAILLFPPGRVTWLGKRPALTSHPANPKGPFSSSGDTTKSCGKAWLLPDASSRQPRSWTPRGAVG